MSSPLRVVLADDHGLLRGTLPPWIEANGDVKVVACVGDAGAALDAALRLRPDVVLMDIDMPGPDSFGVAQEIQSRCPGTRVLFVSAFHGDRYIELALRVRAAGYLVKDEPAAKLAQAIRAVAEGQTYFSRVVEDRIIVDNDGLRLAAAPAQSRASTLTARELEILRHVSGGLANKQVAQLTGISPRTVERHVANILRRLALRSRVELARYAVEEGLVAAAGPHPPPDGTRAAHAGGS